MMSLILIAVMVIMSGAAAAYAGDAMEKLGRGTANVATCAFELPQSMGETCEEKGPFAGFTWGVFDGIVNVVKRAAVGAYEIATFALPIPRNYEPIVKDPEFFLQPEERGRL